MKDRKQTDFSRAEKVNSNNLQETKPIRSNLSVLQSPEGSETGGSSIYLWNSVKDGDENRRISWKSTQGIVRFSIPSAGLSSKEAISPDPGRGLEVFTLYRCWITNALKLGTSDILSIGIKWKPAYWVMRLLQSSFPTWHLKKLATDNTSRNSFTQGKLLGQKRSSMDAEFDTHLQKKFGAKHRLPK